MAKRNFTQSVSLQTLQSLAFIEPQFLGYTATDMGISLDLFAEHLFVPESGVYDPVGIHHEFNQGLHGRKIDCDKILEGTPLYDELIKNEAQFIRGLYSPKLLGRAVLIGVANGTNRIARDTALELDCGVVAIETEKLQGQKPTLTAEAVKLLLELQPNLAIITEDLGTRGTNSAAVVGSVYGVKSPGLTDIEVVNTVQRGILEWLLENGVVYHSMITRLTKDYTPEQCVQKGYCAQGWELVPYGS